MKGDRVNDGGGGFREADPPIAERACAAKNSLSEMFALTAPHFRGKNRHNAPPSYDFRPFRARFWTQKAVASMESGLIGFKFRVPGFGGHTRRQRSEPAPRRTRWLTRRFLSVPAGLGSTPRPSGVGYGVRATNKTVKAQIRQSRPHIRQSRPSSLGTGTRE